MPFRHLRSPRKPFPDVRQMDFGEAVLGETICGQMVFRNPAIRDV